MSQTPKSPPISPPPGTNQSNVSMTPVLNGIKDVKISESQQPMNPEPVLTQQEVEPTNGNGNRNEEQEVQVPATDPANRSQPPPQNNWPEPVVTPEPKVQPLAAQPPAAQSPAAQPQHKPQPKPQAAKKPEQQDVNRDLEAYNWKDLQNRYTKELQDVNDEQVKILEDFDRFAEAFSNWTQAATQRDTERAAKRLKTRERYVQLAEHKLEEKKQHYNEVVEAFKKALALLRR